MNDGRLTISTGAPPEESISLPLAKCYLHFREMPHAREVASCSLRCLKRNTRTSISSSRKNEVSVVFFFFIQFVEMFDYNLHNYWTGYEMLYKANVLITRRAIRAVSFTRWEWTFFESISKEISAWIFIDTKFLPFRTHRELNNLC